MLTLTRDPASERPPAGVASRRTTAAPAGVPVCTSALTLRARSAVWTRCPSGPRRLRRGAATAGESRQNRRKRRREGDRPGCSALLPALPTVPTRASHQSRTRLLLVLEENADCRAARVAPVPVEIGGVAPSSRCRSYGWRLSLPGGGPNRPATRLPPWSMPGSGSPRCPPSGTPREHPVMPGTLAGPRRWLTPAGGDERPAPAAA